MHMDPTVLSFEQIVGYSVVAVVLGLLALLLLAIGLRMIVRAVRSHQGQPDQTPSSGELESYVKERARILDMLEAGTINGAEAERLLAALDQGPAPSSPTTRSTVSWPRILCGVVLVGVALWLGSVSLDYADAALRGRVAWTMSARVATPWPRIDHRGMFKDVPVSPPKWFRRTAGALVLVQLPGVAAVLFLFVFWIWMLIDCICRPVESFAHGSPLTVDGKYDRLIWIVGMFLVLFIATIAYYIVVYRRGRPVPLTSSDC